MTSLDSKASVWQRTNVKVTRFNRSKVIKKGLLGYIVVYVEELDCEFKNLGIFNNGGKISITAPSLSPSPETYNKWLPILIFYNRHDQVAFEKKVLEAFLKYCGENDVHLDLGSGILMI